MVKEGGLGEKLSDLPIAGAAPEAMCEKAIAIGFYCVASGAYVNYAPVMRVLGSEDVTRFLTEDVEAITGGKFTFEEDPVVAARLMMAHMDTKRAALKLRPLMYTESFLRDDATDAPAREVSEEEREAVAASQMDEHHSGPVRGCGGERV